MKISIVTTLYYSSSYLEEFYQRMKTTVEQITSNYEIIFVDDGSPDNSSTIVKKFIKENNLRIKLVQLSRNFGHHKAMITGLEQAEGDYIFSIDCDLEEKPEVLIEFWNNIQSSDENDEPIDLVYGIQRKRQGSWFGRLSGQLYFSVVNLLTNTPLTNNSLNLRLMTKKFLKSMLQFKEKEFVMHGIEVITGFKRKAIYVQKLHKGKTTYTLSKKINLAINSITMLSAKPLVYIFYLGCFIIIISFLILMYLIGNKIFFGTALNGWTSLIVSIWMFGGLLIFCIGIIGIYLSIIFSEVKNRPTIIQNQFPPCSK